MLPALRHRLGRAAAGPCRSLLASATGRQPMACTLVRPPAPGPRGGLAGRLRLQHGGTAPSDSLRTEHFRLSPRAHPLNAKPLAALSKDEYESRERSYADKTGRQQNHIWSPAELRERLATARDVHHPVELSDHVMYGIMYYGLYHPFNLLTGYSEKDPSPQSIEWRLIILESFAGVPGFVAAGFRHFRSLRLLQKDYGWIGTLLEEAENERMHLLVCLRMFEASLVTRSLCVAAQLAMTPFLMLVYMVKPKAMHRFVGYLEQTACMTYKNIIDHIETPGTRLNKAWGELAAPEIAKGYWHLPDDAKWVDALKCMFADESNHRDVNHTFASMESDDPNPFVHKHREDAAKAWKLLEAERILREHRTPNKAPGATAV